MRLRLCLAFLSCLLPLMSPVRAAVVDAPSGTWRLFKDSSGQTPKQGAVVEISFGKGSFTFKAVQPGETVEDSGTFQVSGRTISVDFTTMAKGHQSGRFSLTADTLVLPFQMLGDDAGTSTWMTPAAVEAFLAKVPRRPAGPETLPALLERMQKVAEAFPNGAQRSAIDQRASANAAKYRGGQAESYYAQGSILFLKGFYREAWYAFARAAVLKPTNAVYLHNLATVLQEIGPALEARTIFEWVTRNYPNLDPPWGALGVVCYQLKDSACARSALGRARTLAPENGSYDYALGRVLDRDGSAAEAQDYYRSAFGKGYSGSANRGGGAK